MQLLLAFGALMVSAVFAENPYVRQFPGSTGCPESNEGKTFYVTFMSNIPDQPKDVPVEIFVATYADSAQVTVEASNGSPETKTVSKNSIVRFQVPRATAVLEATGKSSRAKVVKVSADQKIVVYGANKEQYTTDAFLALPENVIGKEYYAITWYPPVNFAKPDYCEIAIAATKDGASVEITLPGGGRGGSSQSSQQAEGSDAENIPSFPFGEARLLPRATRGSDYDGDDVACQVEHDGKTYSNGQTITVQLSALEAFQLQAKCDLTGTRIKSNNAISVHSGNARTAIGPSAITRDHLVEQLMPVPTWGRKFVTVPTPKRTVGDYFKIVASKDGTQVTLSGKNIESQTRTLNAGQQWQIDLGCQSYAYISATEPVEVAAFVKSQTAGTEQADPAMSLVLPLEQLGVGYTFTTVEGVATTYTNYMTVVSQRGKESTLTLDGNPISPAEGWTEVPGANATAGFVQIQPGTHTLTSTNGDARFAAYIYGAGDRESYFYPTGMCLKSLVCPTVPGCCCQACPANGGSFF